MANKRKALGWGAAALAPAAMLAALATSDPAKVEASVDDVNPGASVERDLCLTVALPGGASECGDLRLAHALPAVRTLNQARAPVLLYNSEHASPHPVVAANVRVPSRAGLRRVVATLKVEGTPRAQSVWKGSAWPDTGVARIALGYDAAGDRTRAYRYTLEVTAHYLTGTSGDTARGQLAVVNRRESPFGAGWWMAGVEQLVLDPGGGPVLWVGGDGSTRRYTASRGDSVWGAPSLDRPDTLRRKANGWVRLLPGGTRVEFDSQGRHVATMNRLGQKTDFWYGSHDRLDSIGVPPAVTREEDTVYVTPQRVVRPFVLAYDAENRLVEVESPAIGAKRRVTVLHRSGARVDSITDVDDTRVRFGYASAAAVRITSRTDRRKYRTDFRYDAGWSIAASRLDLSASDSIVMHLHAGRSVGLVTDDGRGAVAVADAYAWLDGPRTDESDTTKMWLDRRGAPAKIVDAVGRVTRVFRENVAYPALPTRVTAPGGFTRRAEYDARGRLVRSIGENGLGNGRSDTTRYVYGNPLWPDFFTRVVNPEKDSIVVAYDDAGNRIWQQGGGGEAGRVQFTYYTDPAQPGYAPGLLKSVVYPAPPPYAVPRPSTCTSRDPQACSPVVIDTVYPPAPTETVEYDHLGNVRATITPAGTRREMLNDEIGRSIRTRTQIDRAGTLFQKDTVIYDLAGRVLETHAWGPSVSFRDARTNALVALPEEELHVAYAFDDEGNTIAVERWTNPDPSGIGRVQSKWKFDAAGRVVSAVAADGARDTTVYDPAGNATVRVDRNGDTIRTHYDALGRVRRTLLPARTYARRSAYPFERSGVGTFSAFPLYANQPDGSLRVSGDTIEFTYDSAGNMIRARNRDATVVRSYYPNGSLRTDTSKIRTYAELSQGGDTTRHVYGLRFEYDRNGRRLHLHHPTNLAPRSASGSILDRTDYHYNGHGELERITDPLANEYRFGYDPLGRPDSTWLPGGKVESRRFDGEGNLAHRELQDHSGLSGDTAYAGSPLRSESLRYDARGKLVHLASPARNRDTVDVAYTGLGRLAQLRHAQAWADNTTRLLNISRIRSDALGNAEWSNAFNRLSFEGSQTGTQLNSDTAWNFVYRPGVGRLERQSSRSIARPYVRTDEHAYDTVGNAKFRLDNGTVTAAAYYYDALGQLRATDTRDGNGLRISSGVESYVFEEYRYDPLGRRVLVRARRGCKEISGANGNPVDCNVSLIRRTLWDGDRELYEIQMPGGDTLNAATLENDTLVVKDVLPSAKWTDVTPYYGRVSYVHGGGIDQPLGVVRINYGEVLDWVVLKPGSVEPGSRTYVAWAPFVLVPHWDPRGYAELGSFGSGGWRSCRAVQHSGGSQVCVRLEWRSGWDLVVPRLSHTGSKQSLSWHGTLLQDKRDASNLSYRRNRYVDPASGRFTQEDPIGLAGGLNLYGFANGDPVSYSDPYGLSAQGNCEPFCTGLDVALLAADINDIRRNGLGWGNGIGVTLGVVSTALPFVSGLGAADDVARAGGRLLAAPKWAPTHFRAGELDRHFTKHAVEWGAGNITKGGYLTRARQILSRDAGGSIRGFTRANGDVVRYNARTNEFAVGAADGTIRTLFRPRDGMEYYLREAAKR